MIIYIKGSYTSSPISTLGFLKVKLKIEFIYIYYFILVLDLFHTLQKDYYGSLKLWNPGWNDFASIVNKIAFAVGDGFLLDLLQMIITSEKNNKAQFDIRKAFVWT